MMQSLFSSRLVDKEFDGRAEVEIECGNDGFLFVFEFDSFEEIVFSCGREASDVCVLLVKTLASVSSIEPFVSG